MHIFINEKGNQTVISKEKSKDDIEQEKLHEKQLEKQSILRRLQQLDTIVPRIVEDIIEQGKYTIHESKVAVIAEKQELRNKLSLLETK